MAGLGGSYLTLNTGFFSEYIVGGRGWIAFALALLSLANPFMAALSSIVFGFGTAIQLRLQSIGLTLIPYEFLWMLPYILTGIALIIYSIQRKKRRGE